MQHQYNMERAHTNTVTDPKEGHKKLTPLQEEQKQAYEDLYRSLALPLNELNYALPPRLVAVVLSSDPVRDSALLPQYFAELFFCPSCMQHSAADLGRIIRDELKLALQLRQQERHKDSFCVFVKNLDSAEARAEMAITDYEAVVYYGCCAPSKLPVMQWDFLLVDKSMHLMKADAFAITARIDNIKLRKHLHSVFADVNTPLLVFKHRVPKLSWKLSLWEPPSEAYMESDLQEHYVPVENDVRGASLRISTGSASSKSFRESAKSSNHSRVALELRHQVRRLHPDRALEDEDEAVDVAKAFAEEKTSKGDAEGVRRGKRRRSKKPEPEFGGLEDSRSVEDFDVIQSEGLALPPRPLKTKRTKSGAHQLRLFGTPGRSLLEQPSSPSLMEASSSCAETEGVGLSTTETETERVMHAPASEDDDSQAVA